MAGSGGFRAASAYVEITADLDERDVLAGARRASNDVERELTDGGERAGRGLTGALAKHALIAGTRLGEGVRKGAEDDGNRNGFRAFLGLVKAAPGMGLQAGKGLVGSLTQSLGSVPWTPYLVGAGVAAAAVAGPMIGAALAGGLIAGVAAVPITGGIILAAQDPKVRSAWKAAVPLAAVSISSALKGLAES